MTEAYYNRSKNRVLTCISNNLNLDISDTPVLYVNNYEFFKCIKSNYKLNSESYQERESINSRYIFLCENIPGLFKWKDEKIYIKNEAKFDFSLLLAELLHSKSITKGKTSIRKWLSEGLIHYLEKILCELCGIDYVESGHSDYFVIWEKIHEKFSLEVLKTIIFAEDIKITVEILKHIFRYEDDDILEITFEDIKTLID